MALYLTSMKKVV